MNSSIPNNTNKQFYSKQFSLAQVHSLIVKINFYFKIFSFSLKVLFQQFILVWAQFFAYTL